MNSIESLRIRPLNEAPPRRDGDFVLYWMIAQRRPFYNHALQRAAAWAEELDRPLIVLEALRVAYPWASERHHRFVIEGMAANARHFAGTSACYFPYLEPAPDEGKGLLTALTAHAAIVVTDHYPCFMLPRMVRAAARQIPVAFEAVDSNGLIPLSLPETRYPTAYAFRRFTQAHLTDALTCLPAADPLQGRTLRRLSALPADVLTRWPSALPALTSERALDLSPFPIDHSVSPVPGLQGGFAAARQRWRAFVATHLERYDTARNHPDLSAESGLSPYLHFGQISPFELLDELIQTAGLLPHQLRPNRGSRAGFWRLAPGLEAFLDQLVTWRELGFNFCERSPDSYDRYDSLPEWALRTLERHRSDPRPVLYDRGELDGARTHDEIWNAAQRQLRREGRIQNYLRMLWGKKILEWSATPEAALETMIELNNRYAVDGRDPNSYSGIFWVLGRYDRAFGPERRIFGTVRYMSSDSTRRKLKLASYLRRFGPETS